MSLVASRLALRQRCAIERDAAVTDDAWGQAGTPDWQPHLSDVPCRAWADGGREQTDEQRTAVIVDRRVIVPPDTDVTERDRIASVTERGAEYFDGPMAIESVLRRRDHLELVVERYR